MTDRLSPQREAEIFEQMKQALSDAGAFCGECGFEPGDRGCSDCEWCYRRYVDGLMPILRAAMDAELAAVRAERDEARARVDELEALTPAPIQTCRVCGAGYTYGEPCSVCEFKARMARETGGAR